MLRLLKLVALSALVGTLPASATGGSAWIHIQVTENDSQSTRININLPLALAGMASVDWKAR